MRNIGVDWDQQPLGRVSDAEIARTLGVNKSVVRRARGRRGISACDSPDRAEIDTNPTADGVFQCPASVIYTDRDEIDVVLEDLDDDGDTEPPPETLRSWRGSSLPAFSPPALADRANNPPLAGIPDGFHVRGLSTLYGPDGDIKGQWVKSARDKVDEFATLADAVQRISAPFRGMSEPSNGPVLPDSELLAVYPMGDPHLGLFAWADECGDNFDLHIAESNLVSAVDKLVGLSPKCGHALIINLGDFFHTDNATNRTLASGHALDVDTRWAKVLSVGIRTMRRCIDRALEKHTSVRVINEIGNHDSHSSVMLSLCLANYYENNPRVDIDTSPCPFHWFRFGKCLIGVTHGDRTKAADLPGIMASDRAPDWGETKHRRMYCGHVHHESVKEFPGCTVETFRTLAAKDAWHNREGYRSGRDMRCDIWHQEHGLITRNIVGVDMLIGV